MKEIVSVAGINIGKVKTRQAYLESDLRWEYLGKSQGVAWLKRIVLCFLIVVASVTLLAPSYVIAELGPFKQVLEDD